MSQQKNKTNSKPITQSFCYTETFSTSGTHLYFYIELNKSPQDDKRPTFKRASLLIIIIEVMNNAPPPQKKAST